MWKVAPRRSGEGIGGEAMAAACAALDVAGRTVCVVDPRNSPSMRVATRLGFATFRTHHYRAADRALMERRRPD